MNFQSERWPKASSPQHHKEALQNCPSELLGQWRFTGCMTVGDEDEWISAEHRLTIWSGSGHSASWSSDPPLPETGKCAEEGDEYFICPGLKAPKWTESGGSFFIKVLVRGPACSWTKDAALEDFGRKADGTSSSQVNSKLSKKNIFVFCLFICLRQDLTG